MKKTNAMTAFLGKGTEYVGRLTFNGTVRIDGHFKGEISAAGTLIVGEGATVEADIHVSHIIISGEIYGNIIADHRIEINPLGKAVGDIQAPTVVVDEGGIFEGNCRMSLKNEPDGMKMAAMEKDMYAGDSPPRRGTIQGTVTSHPLQSPASLHESLSGGQDEIPAEPVRDAKVSAKCRGFSAKSTRTDDSGFYELTDLEDGKWKLSVEANGSEALKAIVEISGAGTYTQNFVRASHYKTPD